jgi:hypothetical protein
MFAMTPTTPMIEKKIEGDTKIGKGPVVTYAPAVQKFERTT